MFLRCSYFSPNLSLDVLIDLVLIQNNACSAVNKIHSFEVGFTSGRLYDIEYVGSH